jgi:hypothetical protein
MGEAKRRSAQEDAAIREQHPRGKISRDDQGKVQMRVAWDAPNGLVRIAFEKPVAWLALPREDAAQLALTILRVAGVTKIQIAPKTPAPPPAYDGPLPEFRV